MVNIRICGTSKEVEIIVSALREYAKNHPEPKSHAVEAEDIARLIEYQVKNQGGKNEIKAQQGL